VGRAAIAVVVATIIIAGLNSHWSAAALIMRAAGTPGWLGALARWDARPVSDTIEHVPIRTGTMRVRIFRPLGEANRSALLVSGVHRDGINEPRLVTLARELAATGIIVVTPEIDDLVNYRLTARVTDAIEDAAMWMLQRPDPYGGHMIGLIGVSFSGGLAIVAAGRPTLRDHIAFVLSFGGHGNLPRVLNYLCTGLEPVTVSRASRTRPPHDYAVAIVLHQAAELVVPADQVVPLRQAIEKFLQASAANRTSPQQAARLFDEARAHQFDLPEPSRTLMKHVNDRNVTVLGEMLVPFLDRLGQDSSLSPDRSAPPIAPVYLLHGTDDNVIPAVESTLLANHLRDHTRVRELRSGYLTHVDLAARPSIWDTWEMIGFWKAVLSEYSSSE
jgi:dienelactone hydrolase